MTGEASPSSGVGVTVHDFHPGHDFDGAWAELSRGEGWVTAAQARLLWEAAAALRPGAQIVEIGSYRGLSTTVLARAASAGVRVVAIDPHGGNEPQPLQRARTTTADGEADHRAFLANLTRAGVAEKIRHVRKRSQEALGDVEGDVDLLFIDGDHGFRPALDDIRRWGPRVPLGGTLLLHDSFNAVGVIRAQLRTLVFGDRFAFVRRRGSLSEYRRVDLAGRARALNALRQLAQLGYAGQSLAIKAALVLRARPVARLLGHRSDAPGPY